MAILYLLSAAIFNFTLPRFRVVCFHSFRVSAEKQILPASAGRADFAIIEARFSPFPATTLLSFSRPNALHVRRSSADERMKGDAIINSSNAGSRAKVNDIQSQGRLFWTRIQDVRTAIRRNVAGVSWPVWQHAWIISAWCFLFLVVPAER